MVERVELVAESLFNTRYSEVEHYKWGTPPRDVNAYSRKCYELAKAKCRLDAKEFLALFDASIICKDHENEI